jgi:hypothetical protein
MIHIKSFRFQALFAVAAGEGVFKALPAESRFAGRRQGFRFQV